MNKCEVKPPVYNNSIIILAICLFVTKVAKPLAIFWIVRLSVMSYLIKIKQIIGYFWTSKAGEYF